MPFWGQLNLQEASNFIIEMLNYFHDYMLCILLFIMAFVSYIFLFVSTSSYVDKNTTDSHLLETLWTVIPMFILLAMAFPSLYLLYVIEDLYSPSISVKVVGHQWYWEYQLSNAWFRDSFDSYMVHEDSSKVLFHALDVDNRLVLPTLCSILFLVTSADVLHSWTVPTLGVKADAIPGRLNFISSKSSFSGLYYGQCSEICGANHSFIPIVLEFLPLKFYLDYVLTK